MTGRGSITGCEHSTDTETLLPSSHNNSHASVITQHQHTPTMIETLAVITVTESTQSYAREQESLDRVFKIEYDATSTRNTDKTRPSARLEELAGSTYAYRENIALKTIGNAIDVRTASAEHDELLESLLTMAENRIPTYIDGTIESMETDVREHTVNLDAELTLRN